ncbi:L-piperidine-6-carboxylate dehydrogenase [Chitinibacteraceae bacterium HSL-7]
MTPNDLLDALDIRGWQQDGLWPAAILAGQAHYHGRQVSNLASPIDGTALGSLDIADDHNVAQAVDLAHDAFLHWRLTPAPARGALVRQIADRVRLHKNELTELVTLETGKIRSEAAGEVQEWIDICDYAVGLSRQLAGLTLPSERAAHLLLEQWHPLGPVGVITAFNFPVAVWAWNAMIAIVCGNPVIWKPSVKGSLCALAVTRIADEAARHCGAPAALFQILHGDRPPALALAHHPGVALLSATGSVAMGRTLAPIVASRLGRVLLELGGNNAAIVCDSADLDLVVRAVTFSAVGTAGQRCTSLRRLFVSRTLLPALLQRLSKAYASLTIGDPRNEGTLLGPLINEQAGLAMQNAIERALEDGGRLVTGGTRLQSGVPEGGCYVQPAIIEMPHQSTVIREETFAPILYVMAFDKLDEAIALNNAVEQGLSSALFSNDLREGALFIGPSGSDCGLANINAGTSGAEIGGAFGGEKATGGGRESGSDSWKAYMRRATNTINHGQTLPLAQGVRFDL